MCKGIGLDLCEIARMEKRLEDDRFLQRYFTDTEIGYIRSKGRGAAQTMAGIFAAKEALSKALGTGIVFALGKPVYELTGKACEAGGGDKFWLSITHEGGMAAAVCIREG